MRQLLSQFCDCLRCGLFVFLRARADSCSSSSSSSCASWTACFEVRDGLELLFQCGFSFFFACTCKFVLVVVVVVVVVVCVFVAVRVGGIVRDGRRARRYSSLAARSRRLRSSPYICACVSRGGEAGLVAVLEGVSLSMVIAQGT